VAATVAELGEGVKITHDEPTNALIIESSPEAYETSGSDREARHQAAAGRTRRCSR
jgi:hypothetical protein